MRSVKYIYKTDCQFILYNSGNSGYTAVLHALTVFAVAKEKLQNVAIRGGLIARVELRPTRFYAHCLLPGHGAQVINAAQAKDAQGQLDAVWRGAVNNCQSNDARHVPRLIDDH